MCQYLPRLPATSQLEEHEAQRDAQWFQNRSFEEFFEFDALLGAVHVGFGYIGSHPLKFNLNIRSPDSKLCLQVCNV